MIFRCIQKSWKLFFQGQNYFPRVIILYRAPHILYIDIEVKSHTMGLCITLKLKVRSDSQPSFIYQNPEALYELHLQDVDLIAIIDHFNLILRNRRILNCTPNASLDKYTGISI